MKFSCENFTKLALHAFVVLTRLLSRCRSVVARASPPDAVSIMALKVDVKWQKELLKDVEIDTEQPPLVFKSQLFTLTGAASADRRRI